MATTKMNPAWKKKWIAALRSGEFTQARNVLKQAENCGCCLYVLTELVRREQPDIGVWGDNDGDFYYTCEESFGKPADGELAPPVQNITGLDEGDPIIGDTTAIDLNDNQKLSFAEIANRIEKYL